MGAVPFLLIGIVKTCPIRSKWPDRFSFILLAQASYYSNAILCQEVARSYFSEEVVAKDYLVYHKFDAGLDFFHREEKPARIVQPISGSGFRRFLWINKVVPAVTRKSGC
jgi:hypothetical protein